MATETLTVVGNAPYAVALDSGCHLDPGEIAQVPDSERVRQQVADGLLAFVAVAKAPPSRPAPPRQSEQNDQQEASAQ